MSNALHDYAKLFEKYAANNGGTGAILVGEDCLSLANEMRMDADAMDAENAKLREERNRLLMNASPTANELRRVRAAWEKDRAENAKLRELVRSAVRCITDAPDRDSCALGEQVSGVWVCHFMGAARELGVEVGV